MKKRGLLIGTALLVVFVVAILLVVVLKNKNITVESDSGNEYSVSQEEIKKMITQKNWYYSDAGDGNNLNFRYSGGYGYWCNCGNGVDGHDVFDLWEFAGNPYKIRVKSADGKNKEIIRILSCSNKHLILYIGGRTVGFEPETDYKWTYPKAPVNTFVKGYTGIYEIVTMDKKLLSFTVPGEPTEVALGELSVSEDVELMKIIADTPSREIYEETESYNVSRSEITWEEALECVEEDDFMEIIWCDKDGVVEKILFYKMIYTEE